MTNDIPGDPSLAGGNGWMVWGKHVLEELKRLNAAQEHIEKQVTKIHIEIATLKVKSGVWGLVGGAIPVVLGLAYVLLK
ncbi:MAG: hypothetical protein GY847_00450 [Proteobacteria bacterium]|nr:hypothetical protein [Pseudomonadota bacterium]